MTSRPCEARRPARAPALAWAAALCALLAGCGTSGGVEIDLDLPQQAALSPVGPDLASVTLVATDATGAQTTETRPVEDPKQGVHIGTLAPADALSLAIELRSPTERLLGYGRSAGSVSASPGRRTSVSIKVRKPFVYVSGGASLAAFDASLDGDSDGFQSDIALPAKAMAAASTPDGGDLAVAVAGASGNQLVLVSTATHKVAGAAPIPLGDGTPLDVAVSPDGRYAIVAQGGASGGLTVVDLAAARAGTSSTQFIPLGPTGEVAIPDGPDWSGRVYAVVNRSFALGCDNTAPSSTIKVVSLAAPKAPTALPYDGAIHDLAVSADGGELVVADACRGQLRRVDPTTGDATKLVALAGASAVAVQGQRVWGGGGEGPTDTVGARVELVSIDIAGGGETRTLLAPAQEHAQSLDFTQKGQALEQRLDAALVAVIDLSVVPGAQHIALLTYAHHHAAAFIDPVFNVPVIPEMDLDSYEYLLVDTSTGDLTQRVRTYCDLKWKQNPTPALDSWSCGESAGQVALPPKTEYVPSAAAALFGWR